MANKNFQVKFGLEVGSTVTADAATGNITTSGDVAVNGGDITTTSATMNVVNANATTVNLGGGATTAVNIGNSSGEIITPSDVQQTGNKSFRQGNGYYSGSTDIYRDQTNTAYEGLLISNNNMTGTLGALVIRNYGQNTAGGTTLTPGPGFVNLSSTRGTPASPLAIDGGYTIGQITASTNYGDTTGAGTGNGWSNDLYPSIAQPFNMDMLSLTNHRQTLVATFTGSIAATTLTVTAVASGTITPGHQVRIPGSVTTGLIIARQLTSTAAGNAQGSTGTYQLVGAGSATSQTLNTFSVSSGASLRMAVMPNTVGASGISAIPNNNTVQRISVTPSVSGGAVSIPITQLSVQPGWNSFPVATRIINAITGGNTLDIGTHGFTVGGAGTSFVVTTAGNPNGLVTNQVYFIDTIPSPTTITLRSSSSASSPVTGLTNGTNLFISANTAAQSFTGDRNTSNLTLLAPRWGLNYTGALGLGFADVNRFNDSLGNIFLAGVRNANNINSQTLIGGRCTEDWTSASNIGSEIIINTSKAGTGVITTSQIGAGGTTFRTDTFATINTAGTNTLSVDINGNVIVTGDLRINGNDIQASDGATNITLTSNTLTTFAGDIRINGNDIQNSTGNNTITMQTGAGARTIFAGDIEVDGNNIRASDGNINITTTSNTLTTFAGDIRVSGNDIQNSTGNNAISMNTGASPLVTTAGSVQINGNSIQNSGGSTNITLGSANTTILASNIVFSHPTLPGNLYTPSIQPGTASNRTAFQFNSASTTGSLYPTFNFQSVRFDGTNLSPTQSGDVLGEYKFNGNTASSGSAPSVPGPPGANITAAANENWTNTANGTDFSFSAVKTGTVTSIQLLKLASNNTIMRGDSISLQDSSSQNIATLLRTTSNFNGTAWNFTDTAAAGSSMGIFTPSAVGDMVVNITAASADGSATPTFIFDQRRGTVSSPTATQNGDVIGEFKFNGWGTSTFGIGGTWRYTATENWTNTATGTNFTIGAVKQGTITNTSVFESNVTNTYVRGDTISLQDSSSVGIVSGKIDYNRVFGQWQYDATITPAAANTAYAFPFQGTNAVTDYANIATATNTSRINTNAIGYFNLQFSIQLENTDNAADHTAYIWWRKNGVDIANSMGRVYVTKQHQTIAGWNNIVQATATTDYFELMYAVDNVALTFPYFGTTAFGPATAAAFLSIVPVGA